MRIVTRVIYAPEESVTIEFDNSATVTVSLRSEDSLSGRVPIFRTESDPISRGYGQPEAREPRNPHLHVVWHPRKRTGAS